MKQNNYFCYGIVQTTTYFIKNKAYESKCGKAVTFIR